MKINCFIVTNIKLQFCCRFLPYGSESITQKNFHKSLFVCGVAVPGFPSRTRLLCAHMCNIKSVLLREVVWFAHWSGGDRLLMGICLIFTGKSCLLKVSSYPAIACKGNRLEHVLLGLLSIKWQFFI